MECFLPIYFIWSHKRGGERKIPEGQSKFWIETKLTPPWLKNTNRRIIVPKKQHRKLKTKHHEPFRKLGVI